MSDNSQHEELIQWLGEKGYDEAEIGKILERVSQYDEETMHDSIMDSIARGNINLAKIIEEALGND